MHNNEGKPVAIGHLSELGDLKSSQELPINYCDVTLEAFSDSVDYFMFILELRKSLISNMEIQKENTNKIS